MLVNLFKLKKKNRLFNSIYISHGNKNNYVKTCPTMFLYFYFAFFDFSGLDLCVQTIQMKKHDSWSYILPNKVHPFYKK